MYIEVNELGWMIPVCFHLHYYTHISNLQYLFEIEKDTHYRGQVPSSH